LGVDGNTVFEVQLYVIFFSSGMNIYQPCLCALHLMFN